MFCDLKLLNTKFNEDLFLQYNINDIIRKEIGQLFKVISKNKFSIPDEYKIRDFVHLYDFQKYFISISFERLRELVQMKQEHDWINYEQASWKKQSGYSTFFSV